MAIQRHLIASSESLIERGTGVRFEVIIDGHPEPAFAVRVNGQVYAYLNKCAHVPIELDWMEGEFFDISKSYIICATHGAYYRPDDGFCLGGPCSGQRLTPVSVVEEHGQVFWLQSIKE